MMSLNFILCSIFHFIAFFPFFPFFTSAENATFDNDGGVLPSFAPARSGNEGMTPLHANNPLLQARQYCDSGYWYCSCTSRTKNTFQLFPQISFPDRLRSLLPHNNALLPVGLLSPLRRALLRRRIMLSRVSLLHFRDMLSRGRGLLLQWTVLRKGILLWNIDPQ
jgi:hypothetical protein